MLINLRPPPLVLRMTMLLKMMFRKSPADSVPSLRAPESLEIRQPVTMMSSLGSARVDLMQMASSPVSMSQSLMRTRRQESMSMPSLLLLTRLRMVRPWMRTFSQPR